MKLIFNINNNNGRYYLFLIAFLLFLAININNISHLNYKIMNRIEVVVNKERERERIKNKRNRIEQEI